MEGRSALVTGGTKGIGLATAAALLEAGAKVAITGRDQEVAARVADTLRLGDDAREVIGLGCDVRDREACQRVADLVAGEFGRLDTLINNAGLGRFGPIQELSFDDWHLQIDTNLTGVFNCSKAVIPHMLDAGEGWIINIGSLASKNAFANGSGYNASKFGLLGLTDAMMLDLRHDGIRVSIVMPGSVNTAFGGSPPDAESWKLDSEDVARAVVDLIRYPGRALPSRIELRPSQPPRR